jgi:hypothetical protein
MKATERITIQILVGAILTFIGWAIGKAQTSAPSFELAVNAPGGKTTIECVRGCELSWVERGLDSNSTPAKSFEYACTSDRCSSGRIGGWLDPH